MIGRLAAGVEICLAAFRLKREQGWEHPLEWHERDYDLIVKSFAGYLGYSPELAPRKTTAEFLAHRLASVGLHQIERHLNGIPKLSAQWELIPVGGEAELKLAIWRAATVGDDDSAEMRKAIVPILFSQGGKRA